MSRPRSWSGAPSWTRAFAFAVKSVNETPDAEEEDRREHRVLHRGQGECEHPEAGTAQGEQPPARLAEGRSDERADERAQAERRREEAEPLRADMQRLASEERHEDVEVEADGADDRHHDEDEPQVRCRARRTPAPGAFPSTSRAVGSRSTWWSSFVAQEGESREHCEEARRR